VRDRGPSPNGEEVVMDTSQVVVGTSQESKEAVGCQTMQPCEEEKKEGQNQLGAVGTIGKGVRVLTRQPLEDKERRAIDRALLKCFLLLQTVYPAVCNMGVEKSVADRGDALSKVEPMQGRETQHLQLKTKSINQE